jgi:hypothetical protein
MPSINPSSVHMNSLSKTVYMLCHLCVAVGACANWDHNGRELFDPKKSPSLRPTTKSFGACPSISIKLTMVATTKAGLLRMKVFASLVWLSHLDVYPPSISIHSYNLVNPAIIMPTAPGHLLCSGIKMLALLHPTEAT